MREGFKWIVNYDGGLTSSCIKLSGLESVRTFSLVFCGLSIPFR